MIAVLIKNELIKILRKPKTWIVFGLFLLCIVLANVLCIKTDSEMRYHNSPEGVIKQLEDEKNYLKSDIEREKKSGNETSEALIKQDEERIKTVDKKIEDQKKLQNLTEDEYWKEELRQEKENLNEEINNSKDDSENDGLKDRIKQIDSYLENDSKPVYEWEYNGINYGIALLSILGSGLVIIIVGIAVFMSDIVSGEYTPATLKFLLVQPVSRAKVLFSKFVAVMLVVIVMICGTEALSIGAVGMVKGFGGAGETVTVGKEYKWEMNLEMNREEIKEVKDSGHDITRSEELLKCFGIQVLYIIACVSFVFFISVLFKSSMISMAVSIVISVFSVMICVMVPFLRQKFAQYIFLNYAEPVSLLNGDIAFNMGNVNLTVQLGIILMIIVIISSYIGSHIIFTKRDMLA